MFSSPYPLVKVDKPPRSEVGPWTFTPHTHRIFKSCRQKNTVPGVSILPRAWLSSQAQWELLERVLLPYWSPMGWTSLCAQV